MVLETSEKLALWIRSDWRREGCSVNSRIKRGFTYIKTHCLTAYVSEMQIGLLKKMPPGNDKQLGNDFWDLV
jgi:hypothetical protein